MKEIIKNVLAINSVFILFIGFMIFSVYNTASPITAIILITNYSLTAEGFLLIFSFITLFSIAASTLIKVIK